MTQQVFFRTTQDTGGFFLKDFQIRTATGKLCCVETQFSNLCGNCKQAVRREYAEIRPTKFYATGDVDKYYKPVHKKVAPVTPLAAPAQTVTPLEEVIPLPKSTNQRILEQRAAKKSTPTKPAVPPAPAHGEHTIPLPKTVTERLLERARDKK